MAIAMALAEPGEIFVVIHGAGGAGDNRDRSGGPRRKFPWPLVIYVVAIPVWWLAAGNPPWLSLGRMCVIPGISRRRMAKAKDCLCEMELRDVTIFLVVAVLLHVAVAMGEWRDRRRVMLTHKGLAASLFLLFKVGYVRHDPHEVIATVGLTVFSILYGARW